MSAAKSFKDFKQCLVKHLWPAGFVGADGLLSRKVNDTVVVLQVQKHRKSSGDEIVFTINTGISVDALRTDAFSEASATKVLRPESCHWRQRLGRLLPAQTDVWWSLRDERDVRSTCDEIVEGLMGQALPRIDEAASSASLILLWRQDRGPGLTEYERRSNLARLLVALERIEEAKTAFARWRMLVLGGLGRYPQCTLRSGSGSNWLGICSELMPDGYTVQIPSRFFPSRIFVNAILEFAWILFVAQNLAKYCIGNFRVVDTPYEHSVSIVRDPGEEHSIPLRFDQWIKFVFKFVEQALFFRRGKPVVHKLLASNQDGEVPREEDLGLKSLKR
nr:DUF4304 domain-containing protein [Bradyrhizobium prioritasuperba]